MVSLVRSRFLLGNKGPACRGSGQREAGALSGGRTERGGEGLVGAEEMCPPPLPPLIVPTFFNLNLNLVMSS